ncbi:alpha/beta hydrolase family protein [Vibrio metschnikovii]|uniref:alpha/beta hydrolase family protein n=1 Tax=Vibrio metschnikovii TaxID=28172 RepID=UPI00164CD2CB|nr:alpha/beta hydrolase [Vibrio metschnikovii]MBC5831471.1 alpha/beta hydrolase [Vibrio metschnikovii]
MRWFCSFITLVLMLPSSIAATEIGFQQKVISQSLERPLSISIWYPAKPSNQITLIADNPVFQGNPVIENGAVNTASAPLVMLSHGYRGNWRNQHWLAVKLVEQGYVVAAVDHPGTTTLDSSPQQAAQWWQRPKDLSRLLDYLLSDEQWSGVIDRTNVTAIGHSLGGWTVLQLVGAQVDRAFFHQQCLLYPNPRTCGLAKELGLDESQPNEPLSARLHDERIKQVISLDLGLARSFSSSSLHKIKTPVLILAAGIDIGDLPQTQESGFLAEHIPLLSRRYKVYEQAMHFSFLPICKPGAIHLLEEEVQGDGIICKDGRGITRSALHQSIFADIFLFLGQRP